MTNSNTQRKKIKKVVTVIFWMIFGTIAMAAFALVFGYVVMLLWNWLMPTLFGLGTIGFWQAVGVLVLVKLLFGGFGFNKFGGRSGRMKSRFKEKCREKGLSKWQHYDKFWQEEGKAAYETYKKRLEKN
jgi:hypothetical protein